MTGKIKGLKEKLGFQYKADSVPVEGRLINFELELQEVTDICTKEKSYRAFIGFGSLGQSFDLPSDNYMQAYEEIKRKIEKGQYRIQLSKENSLELFLYK